MKNKFKQLTCATAILLAFSIFLLYGCTNLNPVVPQSPSSNNPPAQQTPLTQQTNDFIVTYNYSDTGKVELSANDIVLNVGQKLILQPAPGLTKNTRFVSSGEYFFGDIMQQETAPTDTTKAAFTAIKAGKGKLQIIPNSTETDRATDLWVTVQ